MSETSIGAATTNRDLWEGLYDDGMFLAYPSEVFVRLYHRHAKAIINKGANFIDHGAGSGNNSEFLVRQGFNVTASDISASALKTLQSRFRFANLVPPKTVLIDMEKPPAAQLPDFDAIVSWDCLYYNTQEKAMSDIAGFIDKLALGGVMFLNMPTREHDFAHKATQQGDATFIYDGEDGAQVGAVITVPRDIDQLTEWCSGLEILATGSFGSRTQKTINEFMYLVGKKPI